MTQIDMNLINKVSDLIEVLNQIEEKDLNFPFHRIKKCSNTSTE